MTVLTQKVVIENQNFVLVTDVQQGRKFYATIPYKYIGSDEDSAFNKAFREMVCTLLGG